MDPLFLKHGPSDKPLQDLSQFYLSWYARMLLIRKFEDKAAQLYGQQCIKGFCHLYNGQEAGIVGTVDALRKGDKYITSYRDHAHPLALGVDPGFVMAELFGKIGGVSKGFGGSMHMFDKAHNFLGGHAIVGGQVPLGIGIAFAEKYQQTDQLCVTFMGDGAVWQGCVHEAWNLATLYQLPIIFIIENNGYAMGTALHRSTRMEQLYSLGKSYCMVVDQVDGMCIESVYRAVQQAAIQARQGQPVLIELLTYRYRGHSMSDPATYRTKEEVANYKHKDPIVQLKALILQKHIANQEDLDAIEQTVKGQIQSAVEFAQASPYPEPSLVYRYVYKQDNYPFLES